jgi:hypothetical protein
VQEEDKHDVEVEMAAEDAAKEMEMEVEEVGVHVCRPVL